MDIDEDAVSLGDDNTYEDARQFYADHGFEGDEDLRMKIVRDRNSKKLIIDQIDYAKKVVERFGQQNAKPTYVPLPVGYQPKANEGTAKPEQRSYYQSIIGSLLYLALGTRPDIVHAVIMMSQFMVNPSEDHINKGLHIEIGRAHV